MTLRCVVATANPDKAMEIVAIMSQVGDVELLARPGDIGEIEETGDTLLENARIKALALCEASGEVAIADDTGLEVDGLGGAPGVWSARYAGEDATYDDTVNKMLTELGGRDDRTARFVTVAFAAFPDGTEIFASGEVVGQITTERRGEAGFGYDPIFAPDEADGRTFAQMTATDKNAISHRGRAFRALAEQLGDMGLL